MDTDKRGRIEGTKGDPNHYYRKLRRLMRLWLGGECSWKLIEGTCRATQNLEFHYVGPNPAGDTARSGLERLLFVRKRPGDFVLLCKTHHGLTLYQNKHALQTRISLQIRKDMQDAILDKLSSAQNEDEKSYIQAILNGI